MDNMSYSQKRRRKVNNAITKKKGKISVHQIFNNDGKDSKLPRRSLEHSILESQKVFFFSLPHYVIGTIDLGDQRLNSFFIFCYTGPHMK